MYSQTKSFILTGGWAVALPNYSDVSVNGFKIGAQLEKASIQDHWGWGIEADYINFKQIGSKAASNSVNKFVQYHLLEFITRSLNTYRSTKITDFCT